MTLDFDPPVSLVRELFTEYSGRIGVDLCFQGFQRELENLPVGYEALIVAREGDSAAGCVGVRRFAADVDGRTAELKRLYVREAYRGTGLGRRLTLAAIQFARERGFEAVRLDTLPSMTGAIALYLSLGFRQLEMEPPSGSPPLLYFELNPIAST